MSIDLSYLIVHSWRAFTSHKLLISGTYQALLFDNLREFRYDARTQLF
jgi:hypothetical protein